MGVKFNPTLTEDEIKNGQRIANDHLPKGRLWEAFSVPRTSNFAISSAFGAMVALCLKYVDYLKTELNPFTTVDLIEAWEESVGLPDPCSIYFSQTIEQRRTQVILRLRKTPIVKAVEIEQIIKDLTGFNIKVVPRSSNGNVFNNSLDGGASLDFAPFSTNKSDRFTFDVYVDYLEENSLDGDYTLDGSYLLDGRPRPTILQCLIERIKPANTVAVYHYSNILYEANKQ